MTKHMPSVNCITQTYRVRIETALDWDITLAARGADSLRQMLVDQAETALDLEDTECTFKVSVQGPCFVVQAVIPTGPIEAIRQ